MLALVADHVVLALHRPDRRLEYRTARIPEPLARQQVGLLADDTFTLDFLHPATPASWLDGVARIGAVLERIPLVQEIAGSQLILARRPGSDTRAGDA